MPYIKFYKVVNKELLAPIQAFTAKRSELLGRFSELRKKYNAEYVQYAESAHDGIVFRGLRFKHPADFDHTLFKYKLFRVADGSDYVCTPRKTNKKFYAEFMQGIEDFDTRPLSQLLFGADHVEFGFNYKNPDAFYFYSEFGRPTCECIEITATEYEQAAV